jgi:chemotaxis protein MotB
MRALGLALATLGASACVSAGAHQKVVDERDELAERLAAQSQSFDAERGQLYSETETLQRERDELVREVGALRTEREQLGAKAQRFDEIHPTYEGLVRDLEADLAAARIEIDKLREGLRMSLPAEVLFRSGSAELTPEGERMLGKIAADLREARYQVLVQGHTDAVAIRGPLAERFPTNWELAGARAARVVRVLEAEGVDAARLAAVSLGEHQPIASNDDPEGRAQNRRIELRLIPLPGAKPGAPPPGFRAPGGEAGATDPTAGPSE